MHSKQHINGTVLKCSLPLSIEELGGPLSKCEIYAWSQDQAKEQGYPVRIPFLCFWTSTIKTRCIVITSLQAFHKIEKLRFRPQSGAIYCSISESELNVLYSWKSSIYTHSGHVCISNNKNLTFDIKDLHIGAMCVFQIQKTKRQILGQKVMLIFLLVFLHW